MTKAITDFSQFVGSTLIDTAQIIHDAVVAAAATFDKLPISMADFQLSITACDQAYLKKASRATADIIAFNAAHQALEDNCSQLGSYVNTVAQGDEATVNASGVPSYETGSPADYSAPGAPEPVTVRPGGKSGQIAVRYTPQRSRAANEIQTCTGDPTAEANWKTYGLFNTVRATLEGFTPASTVYVRVRTAGLQGVVGNWSQPVSLIVI